MKKIDFSTPAAPRDVFRPIARAINIWWILTSDIREVKHDVYGKRQTANGKNNSDFAHFFFST